MKKKDQEPNQELLGLEPDDLYMVAEKFAEQGRFDEAVDLCEKGVKLFPASLAMKIGLGKMRNLVKQKEKEERERLHDKFKEERARNDSLSFQFAAVGKIFEQKAQEEKAFECYHLSVMYNPSNETALFALASLYYKNNDFAGVIKELRQFLGINPFRADAHALMGRAYFYLKNYKKALASTMDAIIINNAAGVATEPELQEKLKYVLNKLGIHSKAAKAEVFRKRLKLFNRCTKQLNVQKEALLGKSGVKGFQELTKRKVKEDTRNDLLKLALRLRSFELLQPLSDEDLFVVATAMKEMRIKSGETVFDEKDEGDELYLIESGEVKLVKNTPFGEQPLAVAHKGELFGEMNFIDPVHRSAEALAGRDSVLFCVRRSDLEPFFETHKSVAVQFYWHFWKSLSIRTRDANNLLKTFFSETEKTKKPVIVPEKARESKAISIELDRKIKLLQEQGLSAKELRLLAAFSTEELYNQNEFIFREGDKGDKLYIILDGKVRITKNIPGVGDEALAILGKGDFFGEMALVDNATRSADARAHVNGTTVLTISRSVLNEILLVDVESAYQFLCILCRILTQRLREINLKIIQWRLMSGGF